MEKNTGIVLVMFAAFLSVCAGNAGAVETVPYDTVFHPDDEGPGLVRDLTRMFVSEAGFNDPLEHAALGHTISRRVRRLRRRRGWSARRTMRQIADRTLVAPASDRQRWIHALDLSGGRPEGWSTWTTARWAQEGAEGLPAAIATARQLIRGELEDPCTGPSELWGSRTHPVDRAGFRRGLGSGRWAIVDCGLANTRHDNLYVRWTTRRERNAHARRVWWRRNRGFRLRAPNVRYIN